MPAALKIEAPSPHRSPSNHLLLLLLLLYLLLLLLVLLLLLLLLLLLEGPRCLRRRPAP